MHPLSTFSLVLAAFPVQEDPTAALLAALEHHPVVAIGENHAHAEFHEWLLDALEDPRVVAAVDDVVVEWGNALYQGVMDRYVSGEEVPWDSVTMAWRNTVVSPNTVWDAPQYEAFFRGVRRINASLHPPVRYRVLLADSPIDWSRVSKREDVIPFYDRARAMAEVVRHESLLAGRRSVFVAGGLHVSKRQRVRPNRLGIPTSEVTPVAWLHFRHPGAVFSMQSMARDEQVGELGLAPGGAPATWRTDEGVLRDVRAGSVTALRNRDGSVPDVYGRAPLAEIVDAVLLWPVGQRTFDAPSSRAYEVEWYWAELNRRSQIVRGRPMDPELRGVPKGLRVSLRPPRRSGLRRDGPRR